MAKGRSRSKWRVLDGRTKGRPAEACSAEPIDAQPHRAWRRCSRAMGDSEIHTAKPAEGRGYFAMRRGTGSTRAAQWLSAARLFDLLAHLPGRVARCRPAAGAARRRPGPPAHRRSGRRSTASPVNSTRACRSMVAKRSVRSRIARTAMHASSTPHARAEDAGGRRARVAVPALPEGRDGGSGERPADVRGVVDVAAAEVREDPEDDDEAEPPRHRLRERAAPAAGPPADDERRRDDPEIAPEAPDGHPAGAAEPAVKDAEQVPERAGERGTSAPCEPSRRRARPAGPPARARSC